MDEKEFIEVLKLVAKTLQTDYSGIAEGRKAVTHCLNEIDKAAIKINGQPIVKRKNVLEQIVTPDQKSND